MELFLREKALTALGLCSLIAKVRRYILDEKCLFWGYLRCSAHGSGFIRTLLKRMCASTRSNTYRRVTCYLWPHVDVREGILREVGGDGKTWIQKCRCWLTRWPLSCRIQSSSLSFLVSWISNSARMSLVLRSWHYFVSGSRNSFCWAL